MRQAAVLVAAMVVLMVVNVVLLKLSFTGLMAVVHRTQTLDVLRRERLPEMGGAETRTLIGASTR